jgi:hypothetical protein
MMKKLTLLLGMMLVLACSSDDGPVDQESLLPPITATGENTFGCLIDGKFFRPRDGRITVNSDNEGLQVIRSENNNIEFLAADFKSSKTTFLDIHLEEVLLFEEGTYTMNASNGLTSIDGNNNTYANCRIWDNSKNKYINCISV